MKSPMRVLNLLLVICSITLPASIILAGYFFYQYQEIATLKARLLSENELQTQLLDAQPLEKAVIPHMVADIGYVLNPHMKRSAFKAHEGDTYAINSLGLRDPQIKRKRKNVTRILIVGDSVAFGWKLKEKDRISGLLNDYAKKRYGQKQKVEFFTIAMPGWNVRSERAFLKSHLRLLDPDAIVWWTIANDIEDVSGVIPPGQLVRWASPQMQDYSPVGGISLLHKDSGLLLPSVADKRMDNIEQIAAFRMQYNIPVILLTDQSLIAPGQAQLFAGHMLFIPMKYKQDKRWKISSNDARPSAWANKVLSTAIRNKLMQWKYIPDTEFSEEEKAIIQDFKEQTLVKSKDETLNNKYLTTLEKIPSKFQFGEEGWKDSVLYGVRKTGLMAKAGVLYLTDSSKNSSNITLKLEAPINIDKYPGTAAFTVRNRSNSETYKVVKIDQKKLDVKLELPVTKTDYPVYEISWKFDYLLCSKPSFCSVGKLVSAEFEQ